MKGYETALSCGVQEVAVFSAASEGFSKKNTNCTIAESIERFAPILESSKKDNIKVRGYISVVIACPYDGPTNPKVVSDLAKILLDMGCYEISLGDTIGVGTPYTIAKMVEEVLKYVPAEKLALHCHDTYGQALSNILTGLQMGISVFDSSVAGLGGCPYAKGATGNVATEDVLYMLNGMGIKTGVDMDKLIEAGHYICKYLGMEPRSKVNTAITKKRMKS